MKKYPFFVLLFALYPSLAFLAQNFREVNVGLIARPLLFSLLVALIFYTISFLLIRNFRKAALISGIFLILFFSFGHISIFLEGLNVAAVLGKFSQAMNVLFFAGMLVIVFLACWFILKSENDMATSFQVLNLISLFLVLSSGGLLLNSYFARQARLPSQRQEVVERKIPGPDVYYIILDAYSRQDALRFLGYDNAAFIHELENIGFYVPSCSHSNYPQTVMSMASSLNMDYLWEVIPNEGSDDRNSEPVYAGIMNSRVRQEFEKHGYKILVFDSGADWLNWRDIYQFVVPPRKPFFSAQLDPFEYVFLDTTALHPLMSQPFFLRKKYVYNYNLIHFALDKLPQIAQIEGPKFVYAHLLIPHRPNIFMPDGSMNLNAEYYIKGVGEGINRQVDIEGYLNNAKFINSRLPGVVREIIQNSQTPPIIIIQGDHGYQLPDIRFDILNAYYFPDGRYETLYPEISPVNTFRVVFNTYFNKDFPLLKDRSINVGINRPYGKKTMKPGPCP